MTKNKKVKQFCLFILDKSGSMQPLQDATISGVNEYLDSLQSKKVDMNFTLELFDTFSIDRPYDNVPLKEVKKLSKDTYQPAGGTPLYDAAVSAIERMEHIVDHIKGKKAVSVVIMTDGDENSSEKHDEKCLKDLILKLTKKDWTFAYMGANQDAWANASKMGISMGNTMSWNSTVKGTADAMRSYGAATAMYASAVQDRGARGMSMSLDNFFEEKEGGDENDSQSS